MMIMAIADEQTKDTDVLGAEGYIFRRQKAEKGTDKREVKGGILGRLADSYAWDAAESILKLNA